MYWDICMYIGYQQFVFWYLMADRLGFTFITLLSSKGLIYVMSIGLALAHLVEALHFKLKVREFENRWRYWEYWLIFSGRIVALDTASNTNEHQGYQMWIKTTVCRANKSDAFCCRSSRNSGSFKYLEQKAFIQACTGIVNIIIYPQKF